jgi:GTP-binding protein YchF
MERFGLVGLPNAGKSSLYNALTGGGALAAPYPFATKDPNIGVARVPDERLDRLVEMSKSRNVVHAAVEVVDIGGLVEGASKGEGLGNKFLANIREVDAIVFVLRAFVDDDITGPSDPLEHLRVVEIELALADLEAVEKRLNQATRQSKLDKTLGDEIAALQAAYDALSEGLPLYRAGLYFLLTNRRVLAVVNVGEDALDDIPAAEARVAAEFSRAGEGAGDNVEVIGMCVQLEAEAASIEDPAERAEMLEGFGLGEGALFRMVRSAYHLLGLRTFLTTGDKESRAWTFYDGSTAPLHPGGGHPVGRAARHRRVEQGQGAREDPPRGQGLHRQGRRRDGVPLQRLTAACRPPRWCARRVRCSCHNARRGGTGQGLGRAGARDARIEVRADASAHPRRRRARLPPAGLCQRPPERHRRAGGDPDRQPLLPLRRS